MGLLGLEWQPVVSCLRWVLGTERKSSVRAVSAVNPGAASLAQVLILKEINSYIFVHPVDVYTLLGTGTLIVAL